MSVSLKPVTAWNLGTPANGVAMYNGTVKPLKENIESVAAQVDKCVQVEPQTFTPEEKEIARTNIDVPSELGYVYIGQGTGAENNWAKICEFVNDPTGKSSLCEYSYTLAFQILTQGGESATFNYELHFTPSDPSIAYWWSTARCTQHDFVDEYSNYIEGIRIITECEHSSTYPLIAAHPIYKVEIWLKLSSRFSSNALTVKALMNNHCIGYSYSAGVEGREMPFYFPEKNPETPHVSIPTETVPHYENTDERVYYQKDVPCKPNTLLIQEQTLTSYEKKQARANLGIGGDAYAIALPRVAYDPSANDWVNEYTFNDTSPDQTNDIKFATDVKTKNVSFNSSNNLCFEETGVYHIEMKIPIYVYQAGTAGGTNTVTTTARVYSTESEDTTGWTTVLTDIDRSSVGKTYWVNISFDAVVADLDAKLEVKLTVPQKQSGDDGMLIEQHRALSSLIKVCDK